MNLVNWSVNEQIVASFGRDLVIWKRREHITMIFNIKCCRAISYCPNGIFLAIGGKNGYEPGRQCPFSRTRIYFLIFTLLLQYFILVFSLGNMEYTAFK